MKFLSRGNGYALALTEDEAVLALRADQPAVLRMGLAGASDTARISGEEPLPGKIYYVDGETKGPLTGSRTFRRVRYTGVYPGIDAVYHGDHDRLEFDFIVAPHADPGRIRLAFSGADKDKVVLAENGDLVLRVAGEDVLLKKPVVYQDAASGRREVSGGFVLEKDSTARFTLGQYDPALPLVIDPTISFATYIGSGAMDTVAALETDATGAIYILGSLGDVVSGGAAISFPFWQSFPDFFTGSGSSGCYLAKLRPDGSGGVNYDFVALIASLGCEAMAVAPTGEVSIAGPNGLPQQTVVQTFDTAGSLQRTRLFHIPLQNTRQLRVDSSGNTYALGLCSQEATSGTFYPLPGGFQDSPAPGLCDDPNSIGGTNAQFLLIVTDTAGQISYGTFLGDGTDVVDATALEIDGHGTAYIAGQTDGGLNGFLTDNAFQSSPGDTVCTQNCSPGDAFLMVIDPTQAELASLSYSSFFGGTNVERDIALALDGAGLVYLAGNTDSRGSFPGYAFNDPAIFLSVLDLSQPPANQLLSSVAVVESPATSLLPWLESGPTLRLMPNGWVALMADSTDSSFLLVNPLFSGPYDLVAPNPLRPLLLVYDPVNAAFPLATFLDNVQLARNPHIATFGADNLYVAMVTTEMNRSTDNSPTFGQEDVLLFGVTGISGSGGGNQPPTVFIPFFTPVLYADSPSGVTLNLTAQAFDPEGDPLTYSWSGPFTDSPVTTGYNLTTRLALGLQQTVTVTVRDDHGNSASTSITVDVLGVSCAGGVAAPVDSSANAGIFNYAPLTFTAVGSTVGNCQAFLTTRLDQNPPVPSNLQAGSPPMYFEVSHIGASLVVPIDVCIDTRGMSFPNPASIRLYQFDRSGPLAFWNDITTAGYPQGNQLCGRTNTLGTFAIFYPQVPQTAIETIAGNGILVGSVDGPGGDPSDDFVSGPALSTPLGYLGTGAYDRARNVLYFTQLGGYIRKLDLNTNMVTTVAGNGIQILGVIDGPGGDLRDDLVDGGDPFNTFIGQPVELALHPGGDLVFFDRYTCRIRRLDFAQNRVFSFGGNGNCAFSGDGGPAAQAALSLSNMAFDAAGHLLLADRSHARVRRVDGATGIISTIAGDGTFGVPASGSPLATIGPVQALAFDAQGHLLISNGTDLMRMSPGADGLIDGSADETLTLINGCHTNCQQPFGGDGLPINDPTVFLAQVHHMSVAQDGALLLGDGFRIRRIAPGADGVVTGANDEIIQTIASYVDFRSNPPANFNGDTFATQSYLGPGATPLEDNQGRILVVDANNYRIRRFGLSPFLAPPPAPNLAASKAIVTSGLFQTEVSALDVFNGDTVQFRLTASNVGADPTTGPIAFSDTLAAGLTYTGSTPGCSAAGQVVTCVRAGPIAPGQSESVDIVAQVGQNVASPGPVRLDNRVSVSTAGDTDATNDLSAPVVLSVNLAPAVINVTETIIVTDTPTVLPSAMIGVNENIVVTDAPAVTPPAPNLAASKAIITSGLFQTEVSALDVVNGDTVRFRVTASNVGAGPTTGPITFSDTLAAGLTYTGTRPGCSAAGQVVACVLAGPIAPGQSASVDIVVQVGPTVAAPGPVQLTNRVSVATAGDTDATNDLSAPVTLTVTAPPTLTSIVVTPADHTITVGQIQPFTATGHYSDGSTRVLSPGNHIAAGYNHTCALLADGTVHCWGDNTYGKLGDGTNAPFSTVPVSVSGMSTATTIAAGVAHTCALLADGTVHCWGDNTYGELGDGMNTPLSNVPVSVSGISTATAIATGAFHTCALLADGTVHCWGDNTYGELGDGMNTPLSNVPVSVSGISTATAIAAGYDHTCALLADGTVHCWGRNGDGQLGDGTNAPFSTVPVSVSGISTATAIAAGDLHTCALTSDGTVECWGQNFYGQLGDGTNAPSAVPVSVSGISTATAIATGQLHTCALLADGTVTCWGYNGSGRLGDGTNAPSNTPVSVSGMTPPAFAVVWTSSTTAVATINANGVAAGLSPGATTITATYGGLSGNTTLTVNAPAPNLAASKAIVTSGLFQTEVSALDVFNGDTVQFRLTASNVGPGPTTGPIALSDTLAAGLTYTGSTPGCSATGQVVTCVRAGPIAPGQSESVDIVAQVGQNVASPGPVRLDNRVSVSTAGDTDATNDLSAPVVLTVTAPVDVQIIKAVRFILDSRNVLVPEADGKAENGSLVAFGIGLANVGTNPITGTVTVRDTLPTGLTLLSFGQPCTAAGQVLTCEFDFSTDWLRPNTQVAVGLQTRVGNLATPGQPVNITNTAIAMLAGDSNPQNNSASVSFTVTDLTPPVISACATPANLGANAAGQATMPDMTATVQATDNWPGALIIAQNPSAGTLLGIGTYPVTITVIDTEGNSSTCQSSVIVQDVTPPTLTLPANITTSATSSSGAVVNYTAKADDGIFGPLTPSCTPPSGSTFAVGTTTVNCNVADAAGNRTTGSFTVTVVEILPAGGRVVEGTVTRLLAFAPGGGPESEPAQGLSVRLARQIGGGPTL
ncbi:MAG: HYR domain-containing protein, partial [Nitrospirota bacterium]